MQRNCRKRGQGKDTSGNRLTYRRNIVARSSIVLPQEFVFQTSVTHDYSQLF